MVLLSRARGWFDARSMQEAADAFLLVAKPRRGPGLRSERDQEVDAQLNAARIESWQAARQFEQTDPGPALDLLKRFPGLAQYTTENTQFTHGETILALAAKGGNVTLIEAILSKGADVNAQNPSSPSALHVAAKAGNQAAAELLIKHGADVNLKAPAGPTPLQEAVIYGRRPVVDLLVKAGAKPNFYFDVASGNIDRVRQALQVDRSRAMRRDGWSRTPLDYAAATGQIEMLKLLQSFGAIDEPGCNYHGPDPAVLWAARQKHPAAVDFLLLHGDDPNAAGNWGDTPLHVAAENNDSTLAKTVLGYKPYLQAQDFAGEAPLHTAVHTQAYDVAALLLSAGADPNVGTGPDRRPCGPFGGDQGSLETPLQLAAEAADLRMIRLLVGSGASINARDRAGWTALHHAVSAGEHDTDNQRVEAVEFLMAHGADVNARNSEDQSPLDVTNHEVLVPILKAHGAKHGRPDQ